MVATWLLQWGALLPIPQWVTRIEGKWATFLCWRLAVVVIAYKGWSLNGVADIAWTCWYSICAVCTNTTGVGPNMITRISVCERYAVDVGSINGVWNLECLCSHELVTTKLSTHLGVVDAMCREVCTLTCDSASTSTAQCESGKYPRCQTMRAGRAWLCHVDKGHSCPSWHITTVGPLHIAVDLNQWAIGSVYLVVARGRWWEAVENLLTRSVLRRVASWWIQLLTNSQKIVHEFLFKQWVMLTTQRGAQCPQHSTSYQQIPTVKQVAMLERHHHWCLWHLLLISTGANKQSVVFYSINKCTPCVIVNSCMCTYTLHVWCTCTLFPRTEASIVAGSALGHLAWVVQVGHVHVQCVHSTQCSFCCEHCV